MATVFTLLGALTYPRLAIGAGCLYLLGMAVFAHSYKRVGANTGAKCIGRILTKYSLWALGGVAIASCVVLVKNSNALQALI